MLARRDHHCQFKSAVQSYGRIVADWTTNWHHEGRQQESFRIVLDGKWQSVWLFIVFFHKQKPFLWSMRHRVVM